MRCMLGTDTDKLRTKLLAPHDLNHRPAVRIQHVVQALDVPEVALDAEVRLEGRHHGRQLD